MVMILPIWGEVGVRYVRKVGELSICSADSVFRTVKQYINSAYNTFEATYPADRRLRCYTDTCLVFARFDLHIVRTSVGIGKIMNLTPSRDDLEKSVSMCVKWTVRVDKPFL